MMDCNLPFALVRCTLVGSTARESRSSVSPAAQPLWLNSSHRRVVPPVRPPTRSSATLHDPSMIALSMPIDYWDYLGWKERLRICVSRARQSAYSHMRGDREVYTPQSRVNGTTHAIGSDRASIDTRSGRPSDRWRDVVPVTMSLSGKQINVSGRGRARSRRPRTARSGSARSRNRFRFQSAVAKTAAARSSTTTSCAICSRSATGTGVRKLDGAVGNISRDGVDGAVVYVQDGVGGERGPMLGAARRRCTRDFPTSLRPHVRSAPRAPRPELRCYASPREPCSHRSATLPRNGGESCLRVDQREVVVEQPAETKKDQLSLARFRISPAYRPIPTAPGGWGLRNPEPKGPGQRRYFFSQPRGQAVGGDGRISDSANDPVTRFAAPHSLAGSVVDFNSESACCGQKGILQSGWVPGRFRGCGSCRR